MTNSADSLPAKISPEGIDIANTYLSEGCSIKRTSEVLNIPTYEVSAVLQQSAVREYVGNVIKEVSFNKMEAIQNKLEKLIDQKLEELDEAEMGSNKDISDLLALAHKMSTDMAKLRLTSDGAGTPTTQRNQQINVYGDGQYGKLMEQLLKDTK